MINVQSPLAGLKVLDLSRVLAGPFCTQILGDLGANIIKIENPEGGDDTRSWGPPFVKAEDGSDTNEGAYYLSCNRNKRSVTVNIRAPEGQALIRQMVAQSDVLVENFKVGGLEKYGLDYASLQKINQRLIYCSITGFGQNGPYAKRAGYDLLIQAMSGIISTTGRADSEPGGGPLRLGVPLCDVVTGVYASTAILAALRTRDITDMGQQIDMSLFDSSVTLLANHATAFLNSGVEPVRQGNVHSSLVPYQDFPTADGTMIIAIGNDGQFSRFCEASNTDWSSDSRYKTNSLRVKNQDTLIAKIADVTRTRTTSEWVERLEKNAVPCGPINSLEDVFSDQQVQARGLRVTLEQETENGVRTFDGVASPIRLSQTPAILKSAPPALGQHTREVLSELGIDAATFESLRESGVV